MGKSETHTGGRNEGGGGGLFSVTATFHRQSGKQDNINTFTETQIIMLHLFSITLRNPFKREEGGLGMLTGEGLGGRDGINTRRAGEMKEMEQPAQKGFQNATIFGIKVRFLSPRRSRGGGEPAAEDGAVLRGAARGR